MYSNCWAGFLLMISGAASKIKKKFIRLTFL